MPRRPVPRCHPPRNQQQAASYRRADLLGPARVREICVQAIRVRWDLCRRCGDTGIDDVTGRMCWCQGGPRHA